MKSSTGYLLFFISIFYYQEVFSNKTFYEEMRDIDSDLDLVKAFENFYNDDYKNITENIKSRRSDLGPISKKVFITSSAELTKLLKIGQALLDTPSERKLQHLRRSILKKEERGTKPKNNTNNSDTMKISEDKSQGKKRVKRQGRFQEAAKVDNLKMFRIYLNMYKNLWTNTNTGGAHPLDVSVPKPICILFKHRIMQFFFPPIGDEKNS